MATVMEDPVSLCSKTGTCERITDINMNAQKTPILILTDDKQKLTMQNMYAQYEGNTPVVFADKNIVQA